MMKMKLMEQNVAQITLEKSDLAAFGIQAQEFSPAQPNGQRLLLMLFQVLEEIGGLRRNGHFTFVEFRPYINGNCRICIGFSNQPSGRLYTFACADDLLDALHLLRRKEQHYHNTEDVKIHRSGDKFFMYFSDLSDHSPDTLHNLAVLSEYAID